ncbi:hypothetical protein ACFC26_17535 [Kitasatospora purpeofusca]|uniref:hypothetical protein n=1 Tax=Kitasatospora purpeofusca TaxID=67352 RepID=UPI0035DE58E6
MDTSPQQALYASALPETAIANLEALQADPAWRQFTGLLRSSVAHQVFTSPQPISSAGRLSDPDARAAIAAAVADAVHTEVLDAITGYGVR